MSSKRNPKQLERSCPAASAQERRESGKALRVKVARKDHGTWKAPAKGRDPIEILEESNAGRQEELIPLRYGRMLKSPFTFFRGSAALMAADLAATPVSGIRVQACGDCHLLNFGGYATPERNVIVDINDFDETLPAPWEWDLKRLATSFVIACRSNGFKPAVAREAAQAAVETYRESMAQFADMRVLDVWYSQLQLDTYIAGMKDRQFRKDAKAYMAKEGRKAVPEYYLPKLVTKSDGQWAFKDNPPLIYHTEGQREKKFLDEARASFADYIASLDEARRVLVERYTLMDVAMKVVGIGSVGTRCGILLLVAGDNDPLVLQVKETRASVLEPYTGKSKYKHQGQRVVTGQRLMQAHSDIFLGWTTGRDGHQYYLRQLRDRKMSPVPEMWNPQRAIEVAKAFGWVLARAHARSGDPAMISGYMGSSAEFDKAIGDFSIAYADQTESDHASLLRAVRSGQVEAIIER